MDSEMSCDCCGRKFRHRDGAVLHVSGSETDLCWKCAKRNYHVTDEAQAEQAAKAWSHVWYGWSDCPMPGKEEHLDTWGARFDEKPRIPPAATHVFPYPLRSVDERRAGTPRDYAYRITVTIERLPLAPPEEGAVSSDG